jgi:hypothetical protein
MNQLNLYHIVLRMIGRKDATFGEISIQTKTQLKLV